MCSYKVVKVFFEVWGLQGKVETGVHKVRLQFKAETTLVFRDLNSDTQAICPFALAFSFRPSGISYFAATSRRLCGWTSGLVSKPIFSYRNLILDFEGG